MTGVFIIEREGRYGHRGDTQGKKPPGNVGRDKNYQQAPEGSKRQGQMLP